MGFGGDGKRKGQEPRLRIFKYLKNHVRCERDRAAGHHGVMLSWGQQRFPNPSRFSLLLHSQPLSPSIPIH